MARNKQTGPEIKLYQIDTMLYLTTKNIVSKIGMFSSFIEWGGQEMANIIGLNKARALERFDKNYKINDIQKLDNINGQANETWLRKSGFLISIDDKYELSPIATAIIEHKISIAEYCFFILSKQWIVIKKPNEKVEYKSNLLALLFEFLSNNAEIAIGNFVEAVNEFILNKYNNEYINLALSNMEAARFLIEPLLLSGILEEDEAVYRLSQKYIEIVDNYLMNYSKIKNPNELLCIEESYLNSFKYGVFDIINSENENIYSSLYPNLFNLENYNIDTSSAVVDRQKIYYGAPGTGKSNKIEEHTNDSNRIRTTFHPDSDYSTFVGAYKPTMEETGVTVAGKKETRIAYKYVPQAFLKAYINAWKLIEMQADSPYYLIIEEINRGNCAQIFGDLFQLLDRGDNGESKYSICPDDDIKRFLAKEFDNTTNIPYTIKNGEEMRLPSNLYIWATMNTSDQSLFPIDSAFKRRWDWEYIPIEKGDKEFVIEIGENKYDWWKFISIINSKIDDITGAEDKKLGYWFAKPAGNGTIISCNQFVSKVLFYLWNDVYKDYADDNRSIFRIQDGSSSKKVAFTEFFGSDRNVKLHAFMKANGIEPETSFIENADLETAEQQ